MRRVDRTQPEAADGVVIVIDVIRAFSVAAYALAGGADRLLLVRSTDEAFALRGGFSEALLAGEVGGRLIPGFDHNNSPSRIAVASVRGRTIIQRTGAGTQGALGAINAQHLLVCALVNAKATAQHAASLAAPTGSITLLPTEPPERTDTIEDRICADYLEALLLEPASAEEVLRAGLTRLRDSGRLSRFEGEDADFPAEDVPAFLDADRFTFAMVGERKAWNDIEYVEVTRRDASPTA